KTMLKVLVFAYLNRKYSSRDIEEVCKYDLRFRWLLNNKKSPDHVAVNRFRNKIYPFMDEILNQLINLLIDYGEIDLDSIYIGGTKFEDNANRYTFVWKKSILNYQDKLIDKISNHYGIDGRLSNKTRVYLYNDCCNCQYFNECMKYKNKSGLKRIYVSERFEGLREESEANIKSKTGIIARLNRSIQAEGTFSYIKSGMNYVRFNHRSMEKIVAEIKLLTFAINIRKLSKKFKMDNLGFTEYKIVV